MAQLAALFKPKPKYRTKGGVTRIIRDSYGPSWFDMVREVKARDNYCCVKCGERENPKEGIWHDVHHIRELSKGGRTVKSNLMTVCKKDHARMHPHLHKAGYKAKSKARKPR